MPTYYREYPLEITPEGFSTGLCLERLDDEVDLLLGYINALHSRLPSGTWALFYQDGDGAIKRLALGAAGKALVSGGPATLPEWGEVGGTVSTLKAHARAATTGNLDAVYDNGAGTLTNNGSLASLSVDGVAMALDEILLVKNQTNTYENGPYIVSVVGSSVQAWVLTRASFADAGSDFEPGFLIPVSEGAANAGQLFMCRVISEPTLGTTAIPFTPVGPPTGTILWFGDDSPPGGYLECDGSAISRTAYADLFTVIGTRFGVGDGSTTFNIPDLRGYFPRGWDHSRGIDSGRVFGSSQDDAFKAHTHTESSASSSKTYSSGDATYGFTTRDTGSTGGTETRPKNVALLPCIKY